MRVFDAIAFRGDRTRSGENPARKGRLRRVAWAAGGCLTGALLLLVALKAYRDAHYFDNYEPEAPLNVSLDEANVVRADAYTLTRFTFDGFHAEKIPALISVPVGSAETKFPVVVFLHGIGQNKNFLKEIALPFNQAGYVLTTFDQYTQGERRLRGRKSFLGQLEAFRQRPARTVNEARRLIDYLVTRTDIDRQRIYLVGASYGAVTGTTLMAREPRIRAGVMVYGGGDFSKLLDSYANHLSVAVMLGLIDGKNLNPEKPPLPKLTASQECKVGLVLGCMKPLAWYFLGVADPAHYAGWISPRPVYFQNGRHDVLVSAAAGAALQAAAKEPKKITWYDSDHVGIDVQQTKQVLEDGLKWLLEQDAPFRPTNDRMTNSPPFELKRK